VAGSGDQVKYGSRVTEERAKVLFEEEFLTEAEKAMFLSVLVANEHVLSSESKPECGCTSNCMNVTLIGRYPGSKDMVRG
jgi:hypothetical protein